MAPRIAIIGLGFTGTSLGLALKKARLGYEIAGHDKSSAASAKAKQLGAVDRTEWNLINCIEGAGLVILALPLDAIRPTMEAIAPHLSAGAVVTDTVSTKQQVLAWARELLPTTVSFVGGHPILNKAGEAPENAKAEVFNGATYCLIPGAGATPESVQLMLGLTSAVDAEPFFPDAAEHDSFHAAVGHLPLLMATALIRSAAESPASREMRRMTGSEFRQSTALASTDPAAAAVICAANREAILRWLDVYTAELAGIRAEIVAGGDLEPLFEKAADARDRWMSKVDDERAAAHQDVTVSAGDQMRRFFLGELGNKLGSKTPR